MEGCQSRCPGADAVDTRIEFADPAVQIGHVTGNIRHFIGEAGNLIGIGRDLGRVSSYLAV